MKRERVSIGGPSRTRIANPGRGEWLDHERCETRMHDGVVAAPQKAGVGQSRAKRIKGE